MLLESLSETTTVPVILVVFLSLYMLFFIVESIWYIQVLACLFFFFNLIVSFCHLNYLYGLFNIHSMMLPVDVAHLVDLLWLYVS